jgi:hypothetical protein
MKITTIAIAFVAGFAGAAAENILTLSNPIFSAGVQTPGTSQTWEFRNQSEGVHDGAVPDGYAEYALRAQDELRDGSGRVLSSHDMHGMLRLMSRSYGYTTDPTHGACRGTQCPEMLEIYSDKHLRLTAAGGGTVDVVAGNQTVLAATGATIMLPTLTGSGVAYLCADAEGRLLRCR